MKELRISLIPSSVLPKFIAEILPPRANDHMSGLSFRE
jgi:hypothetical protein